MIVAKYSTEKQNKATFLFSFKPEADVGRDWHSVQCFTGGHREVSRHFATRAC